MIFSILIEDLGDFFALELEKNIKFTSDFMLWWTPRNKPLIENGTHLRRNHVKKNVLKIYFQFA